MPSAGDFVSQSSNPSLLLTGLKFPEWGLIASLISEIFWLYSSYKAWKEANQIGIFITTVMVTLIILFGVLNYRVL